ncbi:MAG: HD domain-containing phosphohydrolase, partial [Nitrospiraceae bacterium]
SKVLKMMFAKSGILYDPVLLKLFVNCVGIIPIGCLTLLDSHELAVVIRPSINRQTAARPWVKLISDRSGNPIDGPEVDLAEKDADGLVKSSEVRLVDNTEYRFNTGRYFA